MEEKDCWSDFGGGLCNSVKTRYFLPCGFVMVFVLWSCAPSSTDTLVDAADKSTPTTAQPQPTSSSVPSTPTAEEPTSVPVSPSAIPMTAAPSVTSGKSGSVATVVTELIQQVMSSNSELPDISYFAQNKSALEILLASTRDCTEVSYRVAILKR